MTLLRFTNFTGPTIDSALARYFSLPVVPTVLGFDPRVQLCHEDDGVEVLRRATLEEHPGIFNVGGEGVLLLSQAIRRIGRASFPVPSPAVAVVAGVFRRAGLVDFSPEQMHYLQHGRVADVSRLAKRFGWSPRPTAEAFADFAEGRAGLLAPPTILAAEQRILDALARRRTVPQGALGA
jgi:UDP-glucose 4-epimerase